MDNGFGEHERAAAEALIRLALAEDLGTRGDLTSQSVIDETRNAQVAIIARQPGVLAGLPVVELVFAYLDPHVKVGICLPEGATVEPGKVLATVAGPLRTLLAGERTALNFLSHLCGVATVTQQFVDAVAGSRADILDTRKTIPGWRILQKYAVRTGGGVNHRMGLYDEVMIKDNHLAGWSAFEPGGSIAGIVTHARERAAGVPIEVEVDTLEQLEDALDGRPDVVLLDNMTPETLREAVAMRDKLAPQVKLEASGSVTLRKVAQIAATGVDRISIGALTHSAVALDIAFDWHSAPV